MENVTLFKAETGNALELPYADEGIRAGFPSPAQEHLEYSIDLNRDLSLHPESTFYARAVGDSMIEAGISEGDILVIDRSIEARHGDMAVCALNGEFTVKFVERYPDHVLLVPANSAYAPIRVEESDAFRVWGVVTHIIHKVSRR